MWFFPVHPICCFFCETYAACAAHKISIFFFGLQFLFCLLFFDSTFLVSCRSFEINLQMIYYVFQRGKSSKRSNATKGAARSRGASGSCVHTTSANGKWEATDVDECRCVLFCCQFRSNCRWSEKFASYATVLCAILLIARQEKWKSIHKLIARRWGNEQPLGKFVRFWRWSNGNWGISQSRIIYGFDRQINLF